MSDIRGDLKWDGEIGKSKHTFIPNENGSHYLVTNEENGMSVIFSRGQMWSIADNDNKNKISNVIMPVGNDINEVKIRALGMVFNVSSKFNVPIGKAINICLDKIDFMICYNPKPTNPSRQKKEYHDFWNEVKIELEALDKVNEGNL